jgi:hypothetical protein
MRRVPIIEPVSLDFPGFMPLRDPGPGWLARRFEEYFEDGSGPELSSARSVFRVDDLAHPADLAPVLARLRPRVEQACRDFADEPGYRLAAQARSVAWMCLLDPDPALRSALDVLLAAAAADHKNVFARDRISLAFICVAAGRYDEVPRWIGGAALPKKAQPGRTFPWDLKGFVRWFATAARDALAPSAVEPAWNVFLTGAARDSRLEYLTQHDVVFACWARLSRIDGVGSADVGSGILGLLAPRRGPRRPPPSPDDRAGSRLPARTDRPPAGQSWSQLLDESQQARLAAVVNHSELYTWSTKWGLAGLSHEMASRPRDALLAAVVFGVGPLHPHLILTGVRLSERLRVFRDLSSDRCRSAPGPYSLLAVVRSAVPAGDLPPGGWLASTAWLDALLAYPGPVDETSTAACAALAERGGDGFAAMVGKAWWGGSAWLETPGMAAVARLAAALTTGDADTCRSSLDELVRDWPTVVGEGVRWRDLIWVARAALIHGAGLPEHEVLPALVESTRRAWHSESTAPL